MHLPVTRFYVLQTKSNIVKRFYNKSFSSVFPISNFLQYSVSLTSCFYFCIRYSVLVLNKYYTYCYNFIIQIKSPVFHIIIIIIISKSVIRFAVLVHKG